MVRLVLTHFNVEAYEDEPDVSTTLVEGQVCFHFSDTLATMDQETAEDCFYVLRRKDKDGNDSVIEG